MDINSIKRYLRHYGEIHKLRGSVIRSTFARVQAGFDVYNPELLNQAMEELEQPKSGPLTCLYCGDAASCWDHLIPTARGGTHQIRNLVPCCAKCNARKGAKTWQEFLNGQPEAEVIRSRAILEKFTHDFQPKASFISPDTAAALERNLEEILTKMREADDLIRKDLLNQVGK